MTTTTTTHNETSTLIKSTTSSFSASTASEECLLIFSWFARMATAGILLFLPTAISYTFIGHFRENATILMAGAGLARIFTNVTALSFAWGITLGLQTLIPQAIGNHNENQQYLIALYCQQCLYISLLGLIPLSVLQFYSGDILCAMGQPHNLCGIISSYCQYLIPFLFLTNLVMILQRVSRALTYNTQLLLIYAICCLFNYLFNWICIDLLSLNYLWTAISVDLTQLLILICMMSMLCLKGHSYIFKPLPLSKVLQWRYGVLVYLKLSIPGLIQTAASWWITELVVLFTGFITVDTSVALTATAITTQINSLGKIVSLGIGDPVAIRVGHHIGFGDVVKSKQVAKVAFVYINLALLIALFCVIFFGRYRIPTIWTADENVIDLSADLLVICAVFQIPFNMFYYVGCVYRGMGFPKYAAIFLSVCQYAIGVPLQLITLFVLEWRQQLVLGASSVWTIVTLGYTLALGLLLVHLRCFADWSKAVSSSQQRIKRVMNVSDVTRNYHSIQDADKLSTHHVVTAHAGGVYVESDDEDEPSERERRPSNLFRYESERAWDTAQLDDHAQSIQKQIAALDQRLRESKT